MREEMAATGTTAPTGIAATGMAATGTAATSITAMRTAAQTVKWSQILLS